MSKRKAKFTYSKGKLHSREAVIVEDQDGRRVCGIIPEAGAVYFDFPGTLVGFDATVRAYSTDEIREILDVADSLKKDMDKIESEKDSIIEKLNKKNDEQ